VPVGGGGLIGGIGIAVKAKKPSVEIVGVEPENAPSLAAAFARKGPVAVALSPTLADGLAVAQTARSTTRSRSASSTGSSPSTKRRSRSRSCA
jgi:threonine dehydratase